MSYREVETDNGALQIFDYMVQQVNEDLFHADGVKLFQAVQGTAEQLRFCWQDIDEDVDHPILDAAQILLSSSADLMRCQNLNGVVIKIPEKIHTPEDVDSLLEQTDWTAPAEAVEAVPAEKMLAEMGNWQAPTPTTLKMPARARLPKRWQPWKFISVAMVVPWLLMHATAVHQPRARGGERPPVFRQPCFKGHVKFVGVCL
eukprot:s5224_g2.t1